MNSDSLKIFHSCSLYLQSIGFVRFPQEGSVVFEYVPSKGNSKLSVWLHECEHTDKPAFKYSDVSGEVICGIELWPIDGSDSFSCIQDGIKIKDIANLQFLIENLRVWRRMHIPINI